MAIENTPDRDASLGLIFRLNNLWSRVDYISVKGNYEEWNNLLDALYRNLLYNKEFLSVVDRKGKKHLVLCEADVKAYKYFSIRVGKAKRKHKMAKSYREKDQTRSLWYHTLQKKDIWLRKFMMKQKLYLKQTEQTPGATIYGTSKRRFR